MFSRRGGQIPEKSKKISKCVHRSKADKEIGKQKSFWGIKIRSQTERPNWELKFRMSQKHGGHSPPYKYFSIFLLTLKNLPITIPRPSQKRSAEIQYRENPHFLNNL
jgi:hypothetical protein